MIHEPVVILKPEMVRIHPTARVDSFVKIEGGLGCDIGPNVHVASFSHINAGAGQVILGAHCVLASHVIVCGGATDITYLNIAPQDGGKAIRLQTIVEEYALLFAGAIILPGVRVGRAAVVGAGSVVTKDVPAGEVWMGSPARFVRTRRVPGGELA